MRVALFVYYPSNVTFSCPATLTRYLAGEVSSHCVPAGVAALERGVYEVSSVTAPKSDLDMHYEVSPSLDKGDPFPDPRSTEQRLTAAFPELSLADLGEVFPELVRSLDPESVDGASQVEASLSAAAAAPQTLLAEGSVVTQLAPAARPAPAAQPAAVTRPAPETQPAPMARPASAACASAPQRGSRGATRRDPDTAADVARGRSEVLRELRRARAAAPAGLARQASAAKRTPEGSASPAAVADGPRGAAEAPTKRAAPAPSAGPSTRSAPSPRSPRRPRAKTAPGRTTTAR